MRPQCTHRQRRYGEARALLLAAWSLSACNQTYLIPERSLPPAASQEKAPVEALPEGEAELKRIASERQAQYHFRYDLNAILDRRYEPTWNEATKPLTDDFAPVEYLKAVERHNEKQT